MEFRSFTTNGALLDVVQVTGLSDDREAYVLPEESLKPFVGESAFGNWTLEVWDNRSGASLAQPPPLVLNWKLDFIFANTTPPATPLTFCPATTNVASVYDANCVPVTNTVTGGEIKYFIVNVPRRATMATNMLSGTGDLLLLYNRDGLPTGAPGDLIVNSNGLNAGESLLLTTNSPAGFELRPGQRYYLGVTDVNPVGMDTFTLSVAFDQTDTNLISVTGLTNGICYTNTIPATNALDYYQFTVSTNASTVTFQLSPQNGNVDLVVRRALPVPDPLPSLYAGRFDYISQNPSNSVDAIIVSKASQPVPISPGVWYLGVVNVDPNPVTYSICAMESTGLPPNIIRLTNDVPVDFFIRAGSPLTNFFLFTIDQTNSAVAFSLYNLNNPADLLAVLGALPDPAFPPSFSASGSTNNPAQILVDTNGFLSDLNGDWYLAVENHSTNDLSFTILASLSTNGLPPPPTNVVVINPQLIITNNTLCLTWNSVVGRNYHVEGRTNLTDSTWIVISPTITATNTTTTYCVPLTTTQGFFRVVEESAPPPPVGPVISPLLVATNGTICLTWDSVVGTDYYVEEKTNLTSAAWTVISPTITATNTTTTYCVPISGSLQFFRIVQGAAPASPLPLISFSSLTLTPGGFVLNWTAPATNEFKVQYATNLPPVWMTFTNIITSTNGNFTFTDDGTQSGGLASLRFYRLILLP